MKKFLVLYRAPISAREQMAKATPEQAKAGMDAWMGCAKNPLMRWRRSFKGMRTS
jgi:hypothetical protein